MTSLPDGCTCYDETTRRCPLPGHPIQSVHPEYQRGLEAGGMSTTEKLNDALHEMLYKGEQYKLGYDYGHTKGVEAALSKLDSTPCAGCQKAYSQALKDAAAVARILDFVANARSDIPYLLGVVRELRDVLRGKAEDEPPCEHQQEWTWWLESTRRFYCSQCFRRALARCDELEAPNEKS